MEVVPGQPFSKVEYLIFDLADGDIRAHLDAQHAFDLAFALRTLHHVAVGLDQLHKADMRTRISSPQTSSFTRNRGCRRSVTWGGLGQRYPSPSRQLRDRRRLSIRSPRILYGVSTGGYTEKEVRLRSLPSWKHDRVLLHPRYHEWPSVQANDHEQSSNSLDGVLRHLPPLSAGRVRPGPN